MIDGISSGAPAFSAGLQSTTGGAKATGGQTPPPPPPPGTAPATGGGSADSDYKPVATGSSLPGQAGAGIGSLQSVAPSSMARGQIVDIAA